MSAHDPLFSTVAEALHYFGAHRPDSPRHAAWVALDKFLEGDPEEVRPPDSLAESQAGLNGPSGSPTSPPKPDAAVAAVLMKSRGMTAEQAVAEVLRMKVRRA